jgi:flagellar hook-basal body complex protein FliE
MVMNIADAVSAYSKGGSTKGGNGIADIADNASPTSGGSFSDALKGFATDAVDAIKDGEKAATAGATGKADLASVVTAINNAELMLQTVVTIRDKVISAYQSIVQTAV